MQNPPNRSWSLDFAIDAPIGERRFGVSYFIHDILWKRAIYPKTAWHFFDWGLTKDCLVLLLVTFNSIFLAMRWLNLFLKDQGKSHS